jgi:hypothetical protein
MILKIHATAALAGAVVLSGCRDKEPEGSGPYARQVAEAVPAIERAVGLKFKQPPRIEARSKAQVREFVTAQITDPVAARTFAGVTAAYKRLGMLPDTMNLQSFLIDLLEEQIVGYYDPKTKVLYVVSDAPKEAVNITVTHELVHALQDQYISLDSTQKVEGQNDRQSAAQAVFEGQAVYEQISAMTQGSGMAMNMPGGWDRVREMIRENQSSMPVFARAPTIPESLCTTTCPSLPSRCCTRALISARRVTRRRRSRCQRSVVSRRPTRIHSVNSRCGSSCTSIFATRTKQCRARRGGTVTDTLSSTRPEARGSRG